MLDQNAATLSKSDSPRDVVTTLLQLVMGVIAKEFPLSSARARASDSLLAQTATPQSCQQLADIMHDAQQDSTVRSLIFACVVMEHASVLLEMRKSCAELAQLFAEIHVIFLQHDRHVEAAQCQADRGNVLQGLGRFQEALREYGQAKSVFVHLDRSDAVARCQMNQGNALQSLGRFQEALDILDEAAADFSRLDMPFEAAQCQADRGNTLRDLRRYEKALDVLDEARSVFAHLNMPVKAAQCQADRGNALQDLGRFQEALDVLDEARAVFAHLDMTFEAAQCQMNRANALQNLGRFQEALREYGQAKSVFVHLDRSDAVARCQMNQGNALQSLGRFQEALDVLDEARTVFAHLDMPFEVVQCQMNLVSVLHDLGRFKEAMNGYDQTEKLIRNLHIPSVAAEFGMNKAVLLKDLGCDEDALTALAEAEAAFSQQGMAVETGMCLINRGNILLDRLNRGEHEAALGLYKEAEKIFDAHGMRSEVDKCRSNRANILRVLDRIQEALLIYKLIYEQPTLSLNIYERSRYHHGFGLALWQTGEKEKALVQFTLGRHALRHARQDSGIDVSSLEFIGQQREMIQDAVEYALLAHNQPLAMQSLQDAKAILLRDQQDGTADFLCEPHHLRESRDRLAQALYSGVSSDVILPMAFSYLRQRRIVTREQVAPTDQ